MISAAELAALRATQALTLTQTASILRATDASDGAGGMTRAWHSVGASACRVAPEMRQPTLTQYAARLGENVGWRVTLEAEADIAAADVLQVGSRYFEVLGIFGARTIETARICVCVEREAVEVAAEGDYLLDFSEAANSQYLWLLTEEIELWG